MESDKPVISLYALFRTKGYQTMRVQRRIKNQTVVILVDTGSTHNFMDQAVVKQVGWNLHIITNMTMTVANGERLRAQVIFPSLQVVIQREVITTYFFVLQLTSCDMVLGVQWLVIVGPILWDFLHITM